MVCTASDLQGWKDFPKGLRVLLLNGHADSANEIKSKLEEMEYIVYTYRDENEALSAIASKNETFHVAIVEVSASNCEGSFKFLESAKDLPTVMTSNFDCLNTTMKCIALGAVEFLRKPLSEDKLRNIWQHVLHKAFNAGESGLSVSLKPIKESVLSILQLRAENGEDTMQISVETDVLSEKNGEEDPEGSDHYPAPSTPQLGGRLVDHGDCQEQSNHSLEKSVDIICDDSPVEDTLQVGQLGLSEMKEVKVEEESTNLHIHNTNKSGENVIKTTDLDTLSRTRPNRKKIKVDWTSELHKKFVKAVDQLGIDQAIPSRILELMKVEGLTRHNVASHLQKYRMQRRQILPKEEDTGWTNAKDSTRRTCTYYPQRPIMAFPPYYTYNYNYNYNYDLQKLTSPVYPIWGQTGAHQGVVHPWTPPPYHPHWPPLDAWHWRISPEVRADAWGCPIMPPPHGAYSTHSQNISSYHDTCTVDNGFSMTHTPVDLQPDEEVIDMVVKEAMSKPWMPLPLGLKPPSTESVLTELSRRGISTVPSHITGSRPR